MSTLDQAFIRAYGAGSGKAASGAKAKLPTSNRATATASSEAKVKKLVDDAHGGLWGPHYRGRTEDDEYQQLAERLAQVNQERASDVEPTPHEILLEEEPHGAAPAATVIAVDDGPREALRPAFEAHRFSWPRNVEVLIAAAGTEFAAFVDELQTRVSEGRKTLAVTGADRGEGRTTVLLALARLAATRGLRVALVDLDLRAPQLAEQLGLRPEIGWDDVYADKVPLADALVESLADGITLLPLRHSPANPRSLAGNTVLRSAIDTLRNHYDLVLIDAGPLCDDGETIDLAAALCGTTLDDAIIVRDRRHATAKLVHEVGRRLAVLGIHRWDIAENFSEIQGY
jgi:Mrp family chromosome partitioning ATPase